MILNPTHGNERSKLIRMKVELGQQSELGSNPFCLELEREVNDDELTKMASSAQAGRCRLGAM